MIHTTCPKAGNARRAWAKLTDAVKGAPVEMWYWREFVPVWVATYADGSTDEIEAWQFSRRMNAARTGFESVRK